MVIYPSLIAPLFDKYVPLEDGSLRNSIEHLATEIKFPLKNIFVVDGSRRSTHSNAYFFGVFKSKQIVLYDTLFEKDSPHYPKKDDDKEPETATEDSEKKADDAEPETELRQRKKPQTKETPKTTKSTHTGCTEKEIVAIICHELGHWHHNHIFKNVAISLINLFFIFKIASLFYNDQVIYNAFGFYGPNMPRFIGLAIIIENIFLVYFEVCDYTLMCHLTN